MFRCFFIILTISVCCLFVKSSCLGERFTIIGEVNRNSNISELYLYKYNNMFSRKFITKVPVLDNKFYYAANIEEVDTYILENHITNYSCLFIWDANVYFLIKEIDLSTSTVLNSPLTKELRRFDSTRIANYIEPVKKLDTLIDVAVKLNKANIDSLKQERNKLYANCRKGFDLYELDYIRSHSDSFISLLKLTYVSGVPDTDEDRKLMNTLSENLKKHSRAKAFFDG